MGLENIFWGLGNIFWGLENIFWGLGKYILGWENIFWGLETIFWAWELYFGIGQYILGLEIIFWGLENIFRAWKYIVGLWNVFCGSGIWWAGYFVGRIFVVRKWHFVMLSVKMDNNVVFGSGARCAAQIIGQIGNRSNIRFVMGGLIF